MVGVEVVVVVEVVVGVEVVVVVEVVVGVVVEVVVEVEVGVVVEVEVEVEVDRRRILSAKPLSSVEAFRAAMTQELAPSCSARPISFDLRARCDCGCGQPDRLEITVGGIVASIVDPIQIDALVDTLVSGRETLWGPRPGKGGNT